MAIRGRRVLQSGRHLLLVAAILTCAPRPAPAEVLESRGSAPLYPRPVRFLGYEPTDLQAGDFNGDGLLDLVVARQKEFLGAGDVVLLNGRGDGTFGEPIPIPVTTNSLAGLAAGDFDRDGRDDLAITDYAAGRVWVLLAGGEGGFPTVQRLPTGDGPFAISSGDLDGDGDLDLIWLNFLSGDVSVVLGRGDGGFDALPRFDVSPSPYALALGRFDGDDHPDLLLLRFEPSSACVQFGNGDGTFGVEPRCVPDGGFSRVVVADFNEDGLSDVAGSSGDPFRRELAVLINLGDGAFETRGIPLPPALERISAMAAADVDGDGHTDVLLGSVGLSLLRGRGDGSFDAPIVPGGGAACLAIAVADFDGDRSPDGACANGYQGTLTVFLNSGDGTSGPGLPVGSFPLSVARGDFNEDGVDDLVTANEDTHDLSLLLGRPGGRFEGERRLRPGGSFPLRVVSGDFDGDRHFDLAVAMFFGGLRVLYGRGDGTFDPPAIVPLSSNPGYSLASADINGDGVDDILFTLTPDTVAVRLAGPDRTFGPEIRSPGIGQGPVRPAHFDADGILDLVTLWQGTGVAVALGNGDGSFRPTARLRIGYGVDIMAAGDVNGDGRADLVVPGSDRVQVLIGNGNGTFEFGESIDLYAQYHLIAVVADLDLDGNSDIVVDRGLVAQSISVFLGDGSGRFTFQGDYDAGSGARDLAVLDLDDDGRPDLVIASAGANVVTLLPNRLNRPPTAVAGESIEAECASHRGVTVMLDGSASRDPDSSPLSGEDIAAFDWFVEFGGTGERRLGSGRTIRATLPLGTNVVTLRVTDRRGLTGFDETGVRVVDTVPPFGSILSPPAGSCHGPAAAPVVVADDLADACDPDPARRYVPPPDDPEAPRYGGHGDHAVSLTATDGSGNAVTREIAFTVDLQPPRVRMLPGARVLGPATAPESVPLASLFEAADEDGASGGIVRERLLWDGCPVLDGLVHGDGDGLLSDESLPAGRALLCRAFRECGRRQWVNPMLRVEASDCAGNTGSEEIVVPGGYVLDPAGCPPRASGP